MASSGNGKKDRADYGKIRYEVREIRTIMKERQKAIEESLGEIKEHLRSRPCRDHGERISSIETDVRRLWYFVGACIVAIIGGVIRFIFPSK